MELHLEDEDDGDPRAQEPAERGTPGSEGRRAYSCDRSWGCGRRTRATRPAGHGPQRAAWPCAARRAGHREIRRPPRSQPLPKPAAASKEADIGRSPVGRRARQAVKLYTESSAVLAWLLDQEHAELVANTLAQAELVIASDLTLIECDRVLIRAVALEELHESDAVPRQERLNAVS